MTTEHTETPSTPEPTPPPTSPGTIIREARERARLSLDDMSAHTKLARPTLEALERDDYHALLEPVYVRGYYRKCAKVLEIDEDKLIAAYQSRVLPKTPEPPAKLRLASGTELGSSSRLPVSMAILAAVVAVVACAFLWFAREGGETYPVVRPAAAPVVAIQPTPTPSIEPVATPEAVTTEEEGAVATPTAAPTPAAAPQPTSAPVAAGTPGVLRLRFVQTSWVRIDDAAGKTLLNGMRAAGTEDTLNGQAPLNVFLGNAPGVQVEFEGAGVDVRAFTRDNNTARFTLPLR